MGILHYELVIGRSVVLFNHSHFFRTLFSPNSITDTPKPIIQKEQIVAQELSGAYIAFKSLFFLPNFLAFMREPF